MTSQFTRLFGCPTPIQLAAMPGVTTPELVSAVARAGGLGMLSAAMQTPEALGRTLGALASAAPGAIGVNFLVPFLDREALGVAARTAGFVELFYGEPDADVVEQAHGLGARVGWQVGSEAEARAAEDAGCDWIVAQGTEAGGHVRGRTSLLPLLSRVLESVRIPVLAAGGIATGRDLAAVLACGAAGARIGTRFVAAAESGAHPAYVKALIDADAGDTVLTETFSVMWPDAPHRVLRSAIRAAEQRTEDVVGEMRMAEGDPPMPVPRFSVICPSRETTGHVEAMALYAGESVANVREVKPAADIVGELMADAERLLAR